MINRYFRITVNVRLTHPASLAKVPTNPPCEIPCALVFLENSFAASAGRCFHVKLASAKSKFYRSFFMMDSVAIQELRDQYNDLTQRVAELRRFL
jgi:hypothetical protein